MKLHVIGEGQRYLDSLKPLLEAAHDHDGHAPLGEHKWLDLVHGGRERYAGIVATEPDHDHPVGYAHLSGQGRGQWGLEIVVHPEHRGVGVEAALVEGALDLARSEGGGHLHLWVFQPTDMHDAIAHRSGLRRGRDIVHMRVQLPVDATVALPEGVTLGTFQPGVDEDAWLAVNNAAFDHHPEQGAWDAGTLDRRMREPWFDANDFLVAKTEASMVGFNWTKLDQSSRIGEIYVIGVAPSHQGTGLGRALSLAGLDHLHDRGMEVGSLYTDVGNDRAIGMYRALGFEAHHTDRAYAIDL